MHKVMEQNSTNKEFNLYNDIQQRTNGEIYIGVVGPVRTGKSTFIKRFMDLFVLPQIEDENEQMRTRDELPQSSGGKTITTTEPKFIPKEAAKIDLTEGVSAKVRLIDCVGYMTEGAAGHLENGEERMVRTPWFDQEIPFTKAAEIGTRKVISDHATIGIVITTDGSFGEIARDSYIGPEERTINECRKMKKPFIVLLNTEKPYSQEAAALASQMEEKYGVAVLPVNCEQLRKDDINRIMQSVLLEFPVSRMEFFMPQWVEMLPEEHELKAALIEKIRQCMDGVEAIRDVAGGVRTEAIADGNYIRGAKTDAIRLSDGSVRVVLDLNDACYYEMLSDITGEQVDSEYRLMEVLKEMSRMKGEYRKVLDAMEMVRYKGYGVVMPEKEEITLETPEVIRHGNKYGVKIKAQSPSVHMIKANIETEIAPIVGSEQQAKDLITYIEKDGSGENGIWDTNIFGKTVEQLVRDGIHNKVAMIDDESQLKLQDTMQKIVNDSNGGMVCIII